MSMSAYAVKRVMIKFFQVSAYPLCNFLAILVFYPSDTLLVGTHLQNIGVTAHKGRFWMQIPGVLMCHGLYTEGTMALTEGYHACMVQKNWCLGHIPDFGYHDISKTLCAISGVCVSLIRIIPGNSWPNFTVYIQHRSPYIISHGCLDELFVWQRFILLLHHYKLVESTHRAAAKPGAFHLHMSAFGRKIP